MLFLFLLIVLALFLPFIVTVGRVDEESRQMLARFAQLHSGGPQSTTTGSAPALLKGGQETGVSILTPVLRFLSGRLQLEPLMLQAGSSATVLRMLWGCLASGAVLGMLLALVLRIAIVALAGGMVGCALPWLYLRMRRERKVRAMNKALPGAIDIMSRALRAGHSLPAALGMVAEQAPEPARAEFSEVFRQQQFGLPMRDALLAMLARVPSQDLRVLVTGLLVQKDTGGNLTRILDRTSGVIRERLKLQGDVRVHTAQGRMTGWILCLLPVVMLLLLNLINPGYSRALTDDPTGRKCLYAGMVLLAIGAFMIRRIVNGIEV